MRVAVAWASAGWLVFAMGTVACSGDDDGGPAAPRLGGGCDAAQAAECLGQAANPPPKVARPERTRPDQDRQHLAQAPGRHTRAMHRVHVPGADAIDPPGDFLTLVHERARQLVGEGGGHGWFIVSWHRASGIGHRASGIGHRRLLHGIYTPEIGVKLAGARVSACQQRCRRVPRCPCLIPRCHPPLPRLPPSRSGPNT